jgi:Toprim-like
MNFEDKIIAELKHTFNFKSIKGAWMQQGKCPDCGKNEVYCSAKSPKMVKCSREDRCGWSASIKSLFPELFEDWSKSHPVTEANPNATADAYLSHERGLDLMGMRGAYTQEFYKDQKTNLTSATVRFALPNDGWWERIIDRPGRFDRKARFRWRDPKILEKLPDHAAWHGHCWTMPDHSFEHLATMDEIWLNEGVFDSWALNLAFKSRKTKRAAVSSMSTNNWPEHFLNALRKAIADGQTPQQRPRLVFAFDVGAAGVRFTKKYVEQAIREGWEATAAQVRPDGEGDKLDWNDQWLRHRDWKGEADKAPLAEKAIQRYLDNGAITIASTYSEKARLLHNLVHKAKTSFWFRHNSCTYWTKVKFKDDENGGRGGSIELETEEITNCAFHILYREFDTLEKKGTYYLNITYPWATPQAKAPFSATAMSSGGEFDKALLNYGCSWAGTTEQLKRIVKTQIFGLKMVRPVRATGYSPDHKAWLFGNYAVHGGRLFEINSEDYFDIGKIAVKNASAQKLLKITPFINPPAFDWISDIWVAWRANGLISLAFWMASLFAVQIRKKQASFTLLELTGAPDSGKSTMVKFLWRTLGRDEYEGFNPSTASRPNIARNFLGVSNLPVGLTESNMGSGKTGSHFQQYNYEELLGLYGGQNPRGLAVKTNGFETFEPPFTAAAYLMQNERIDASPQVLQRLVSLFFSKAHFTPDTKAAAMRLEATLTEDVSGTIIHIVRQEEKFLSYYFERFAHHEKAMPERIDGLHPGRPVKTHSQIAAAVETLQHIFPEQIRHDWVQETLELIYNLALERQNISGSDHPRITEFWERVEYILAREEADLWVKGQSIDQSREINRDKIISISMTMYEAKCRAYGFNVGDLNELRRLLRNSKTYKFIAAKGVNNPAGKNVSCFLFDRPVQQPTVQQLKRIV